jgi:hypothetical protein
MLSAACEADTLDNFMMEHHDPMTVKTAAVLKDHMTDCSLQELSIISMEILQEVCEVLCEVSK